MQNEAREGDRGNNPGIRKGHFGPPETAPPSSRRAHPAADGAAALRRVQVEIDATDPQGTVICVDIPTATATLLAALPGVLPLRAALVAELPSFDVAALDRLEDYALALQHLHAQCLADPRCAGGANADLAAATALRDDLRIAAEALARRGLIERARVAAPRTLGPALARDLAHLAKLFRERWADVDGRTAIEVADLARAEAFAARPLRARPLSAPERREARLAAQQLLDRRTRCFALLVRAHDECRHALAWLRRTRGDAHDLLPPLHARGGRKGRARTTSQTMAKVEVRQSEQSKQGEQGEQSEQGEQGEQGEQSEPSASREAREESAALPAA